MFEKQLGKPLSQRSEPKFPSEYTHPAPISTSPRFFLRWLTPFGQHAVALSVRNVDFLVGARQVLDLGGILCRLLWRRRRGSSLHAV